MSCLSCKYLGKTITPTTLYNIVSYYCKKTQKNANPLDILVQDKV